MDERCVWIGQRFRGSDEREISVPLESSPAPVARVKKKKRAAPASAGNEGPDSTSDRTSSKKRRLKKGVMKGATGKTRTMGS